MNIAIVGSNGYIARYLKKALSGQGHAIIEIDKDGVAIEPLDLERPDIFDYRMLDFIDFVIFTAAISGPDMCANEFELCWKINVDATKYFINQAISKGCKVLFFSSDAVYGDMPGYIYTEESELGATTAYGRMKKAVEEGFQEQRLFKAIRLSYVMSVNDRFISYCMDCIRKKITANIFHPFYRNVISISDVVYVVLWFVDHFEEYDPKALNVAGDELVSRVRMADELNRIYNNKLEYIISKPNEGFFKNRPKITQMKSLYLKKYEILEPGTFTEKIKKEMEGIEI